MTDSNDSMIFIHLHAFYDNAWHLLNIIRDISDIPKYMEQRLNGTDNVWEMLNLSLADHTPSAAVFDGRGHIILIDVENDHYNLSSYEDFAKYALKMYNEGRRGYSIRSGGTIPLDVYDDDDENKIKISESINKIRLSKSINESNESQQVNNSNNATSDTTLSDSEVSDHSEFVQTNESSNSKNIPFENLNSIESTSNNINVETNNTSQPNTPQPQNIEDDVIKKDSDPMQLKINQAIQELTSVINEISIGKRSEGYVQRIDFGSNEEAKEYARKARIYAESKNLFVEDRGLRGRGTDRYISVDRTKENAMSNLEEALINRKRG